VTRDIPHPGLREIESQDGHEYYKRPVPDSADEEVAVSLDCIDESLDLDLSAVDGYPVHHLYVECEEVKKNGLPLEADPRKPEDSKQVTAMTNTLEDHPSDFIKYNNGIVVLCKKVGEMEDGSVELKFRRREGICNGGHTYFSFYQADSVEGAAVHIEAIELPEKVFDSDKERERKITKIAQARNNNNQLDRRSIANFLGYFEPFKQALINDRVVEWNEGDPRAYSDEFDSVDFIRLVKTWDIESYRHPLYNPDDSNHRSLAVSKGKILRSWANKVEEAQKNGTDRPLEYLIPVLNDLMYVRDFVSYELKEGDLGRGIRRSKFYKEYIKNEDANRQLRHIDSNKEGIRLPRPLEVLFVGLFRTNLYLSRTPGHKANYIGWYMGFDQIWSRRIKSVLGDMNDTYKGLDTPKRQFKRLNGPFSQDLFRIMVGQTPDPPTIIYDSEKASPDSDGGVYISDPDGRYWLDRNDEQEDEIHDTSQADKPDRAPSYSEISLQTAFNKRPHVEPSLSDYS
jgi:hypothetical protein